MSRILLVDDDPGVREATALALASGDMRCGWRQMDKLRLLGSCWIIAVSGLYREGDDARLAALGIDHFYRNP